MIPRFNIKQIKNRLEGNARWLDYIPPVLNFADDSLSLGKYILSVGDAWNWNIDTFNDFVELYDALPGYQSFDEQQTGKTSGVLEFDDKETEDLLSAFTGNLFVGWSDEDGSAVLVDENGDEISSSDVMVDKSHIKMGESRDGTLLASFGDQVFEVKQIDGQFYAFRPVEDAVVSYKAPQDVIFVLPNYFYNTWNGDSFEAFYRTEEYGWRSLEDVEWTPDMRFVSAERGPELELMENGYIDWEEAPDFSVEIDITEKNVDQWSDLIASMKKESEDSSSFRFSLEKVSDDT